MNTVTQNPAPTFETVWAALMETDRQMKETDRKREASDRRYKKEREARERRWAESDRKHKEEMAERDRKHKEEMAERDRLFNERANKINEQIGGISRSNGQFCEEYFVNVYKENPVFMGEKFDRVLYNLKPEPAVVNDQYDLILRNGKTVVLMGMKYKTGTDDVGRMFRKLETYRANYPMFKDYRIYLCIASFRFPDEVRKLAAEQGIVLVQQKGDINEVISENVRTW